MSEMNVKTAIVYYHADHSQETLEQVSARKARCFCVLQDEVERLQTIVDKLCERDLAMKAAQIVPRHRSRYTGMGPNDGLAEAADVIQRVYHEAAAVAKEE